MSVPRKLLTIDGVTRTIRQWAEQTGVRPQTIHTRLCRGWLDRQAVGLRPGPGNRPGPKTRASLEPEYMRRRNAERRSMAKKLGICQECQATKAAPGRTRCPACLSIDSFRSAQRQKAA